MNKLIAIILLSMPLMASETSKAPKRTWGEWFDGRPSPGSPADFQWMQSHQLYIEHRRAQEYQTAWDKCQEMNGSGSEIAAKAGTGALMLLGEGIVYAGTAIKGAAVAATTKAAAVGVAVITAPATPWIVGGAAVSYGGYKTYRHFNPTKESQAKDAELDKKREVDLEQAEFAKCKRERSQSVKGLRDCVYQYRRSRTFTSSGLPTECEDHESRVSLHEDGDTEVVSMAKRFAQHAPMKTKETT